MNRPKTAFGDVPRGTVFYLNPLPPSQGGHVVYVGYDTNDGPEHILFSKTSRNDKPDHALAEDIDSKGVQSPCLVRKNGPAAEIIFGRRRLLGTRLANTWRADRGDELRMLPCIKFQGSDADLLEILISENAHREDEDPIERARQAMKLLSFRPKAAVARAANVSVQTLGHWERVLDTSPKVQDAVRSRQLAWGAAAGLVELPFAEQEAKLSELLEQQRANGVRPTAREVTRQVNPDKVLKPKLGEIKRVLAAVKSGDFEDPGAEYLLRWVTGDLAASRIKGLTKVLS